MSDKPKCRSCKAPILWAETVRGRRMPIDAQPAHDGNIRLDYCRGEHHPPIAIIVTGPTDGMTLYQSHFATCPNADEHRKN